MSSVTKGIFSLRRIFTGLVLAVLLASLLAACGDAPTVTPSNTVAAAATSTNAPATTSAATTTSAPVATTAPATALPTVTNLPAATTPARTTVAATTAVATTAVATTVAATTAPVQTTSAPATTVAATTAPVQTTAPASSARRLAFVDGNNLKVIDATGQNPRTIVEGKGEYARIERLDWSPDNTQLVFTGDSGSSKASSIYLTNLSGAPKKLLANQPANTRDSDARFSPDGKLIAFTRVNDTNGDRTFDLLDRAEVWVVEATGQNPRKLTDGRQPAFAPDNARIAFVTNGTIEDKRVIKNAIGMINTQGQNRWEPFDTTKMPEISWIGGEKLVPLADRLASPVWLDNGRTLGFLVVAHHSLIATMNASTGRDVKVWDMAFDANFGSLEGATKGTWLAGMGLLNSGVPTTHLIDTTGKADINKPPRIMIGGPREGYAAVDPTINVDGSFVAFIKVKGSMSAISELPFDGSTDGSLVVAQVKNGKAEEREIAKGKLGWLTWSK